MEDYYVPRHADYKIGDSLWMDEFSYEHLQILREALIREVDYQKENNEPFDRFVKFAGVLYKVNTIIEKMEKFQ